MSAPSFSVYVRQDVVALLAPAAARRGMSVANLIRTVVTDIANDGLVDAILDDGKSTSGSDPVSCLRKRMEVKDARIAELEELLVPEWIEIPQSLNLTRRQAQVLRALLSRQHMSRDALAAIVYGAGSDVDPDSIWTHVSHLRAKLLPLGVPIRSVRHQGYWIDDRHKVVARLAAMCAEEAPLYAVAAE